jgi:hypothetical protein
MNIFEALTLAKQNPTTRKSPGVHVRPASWRSIEFCAATSIHYKDVPEEGLAGFYETWPNVSGTGIGGSFGLSYKIRTCEDVLGPWEVCDPPTI